MECSDSKMGRYVRTHVLFSTKIGKGAAMFHMDTKKMGGGLENGYIGSVVKRRTESLMLSDTQT